MKYNITQNNIFTTEYVNSPISKTEYRIGEYDPIIDREKSGELSIYFKNGNIITHSVYLDLYARQFGITIDGAGLMFLIPSWYGNLKAYSVRTGNVWWRAKIKRTSKIFHYMNSFLCLSNENTLYKLDIENGNTIMKKRVSKWVFDISYSYLLCLNREEKWEIISKDDFSVIQAFENDDMIPAPIMDVFVYKNHLNIFEASLDICGNMYYRINRYDIELDKRVTKDHNSKEFQKSRTEIIRKLYGDII